MYVGITTLGSKNNGTVRFDEITRHRIENRGTFITTDQLTESTKNYPIVILKTLGNEGNSRNTLAV
jgi:hypothetical protein